MLEKPPEQPDLPPLPSDAVALTPQKKPNVLERFLAHRATPWVVVAAAVVTLSGIMQENSNDKIDALQNEMSQNDERHQQQIDRAARIAGQAASVSTDTVLGVGLKPVEQLPGYSAIVSSGQRVALQGSSISLLLRPKPKDNEPPGDWSIYCSGNIVQVGDRRVVATAAACFPDVDRIQTPTEESKTAAYDIGRAAAYDYAVIASTTGTMPHQYAPDTAVLGRVRNIAVIPSGRTALLGIDTATQPVAKQDGVALFDRLPALAARIKEGPTDGQQVALAPRLESQKNSLREASGTLLGLLRYTDEVAVNDSFFAVGMKANPPQNDGCGFGAVGMLADGSFAGPAYERLNPSAEPGDVTKVLQIEDALKLDASPFAAICKFDNPDAEELSRLAAAFNRPPASDLMAPPS